MQDIFNLGAESDDPESLEKRLQSRREELHSLKQDQADEFATLNARKTAKLNWLASKSDKIRDRYMQLNRAFEDGNKKEAVRLIYILDDIEKAVLSMPVLDQDGSISTFYDWMDTAFAGEDKTGGIKAKAKKALETDKAACPEFDDIEEKAEKVDKPNYKKIEDGFIKKLKGDYERELHRAIRSVGGEIERERHWHSEDVQKYKAEEKAQISTKINEINDEMLVVSTLIRLDKGMAGSLKETTQSLNAYLPLLIDKYGFDKTIARMIGDESNSPALNLLEKTKYAISDSRHPLQIFLGVLDNDLQRSATLLQMSKMSDVPYFSKELESLAANYVGENIRVDEQTLVMPAKAGFVTEYKDRLKFFLWGSDVRVSSEHKEDFIKHLGNKDGYITDRGEVINQNALCFAQLGSKGDSMYLNYPGNGRRIPVKLAKDGESVEEYSAYTSSFYSSFTDNYDHFTSLDDKALINKNMIDHAWIEKDEDKYSIKLILKGMAKETINNISSLEQARSILTELEDYDSSTVFLNENEIVKTSSIGNAWASRDKQTDEMSLKYIIGGKQYSTKMSAKALSKMSALLKDGYGFMELDQGYVDLINPDNIALAYYDKDEGKLKYVIGSDVSSTKMSEKQALKALNKLEKNHPFVRHQNLALINPDHMSRIFYDKKEGKLKYVIGQSNWSSTVSKDSRARVFSDLSTRSNYVQLTSNTYLNKDDIFYLYYDKKEGRLEYDIKGDSGRWTLVDEQRALDIIDELEEHGKKLSLDAIEQKYADADLDYRPEDKELSEIKQPNPIPEQDNKADQKSEKKFPELFRFGPK